MPSEVSLRAVPWNWISISSPGTRAVPRRLSAPSSRFRRRKWNDLDTYWPGISRNEPARMCSTSATSRTWIGPAPNGQHSSAFADRR